MSSKAVPRNRSWARTSADHALDLRQYSLVDRDAFVAQYWEEWRLFRGDRDERMRLEEMIRSDNEVADVVRDEVDRGDPSVVDLLVSLAEGAPTEDDAGLLGAGPLEDLIWLHFATPGATRSPKLLDALDTAARQSARFRRALRSVVIDDEVPAAVRERLQRFNA